MARDPTRLRVFELAHGLAIQVYRLTDLLPNTERFGLSAQLRRAATSIPANIVEGCSRHSVREYDRFLEVASGSAAEVRYLLRLVVDLKLLTCDRVKGCEECSDHVIRALQKLRTAVDSFER